MPEKSKRRPITHDLKCWPELFEAIRTGIKSFEYRVNDRDYQVGDRLRLREFVPCKTCKGSGWVMDYTDRVSCDCMFGRYPKGRYTGRKLLRDITYKLNVDKMVIMSIAKLPPRNKKQSEV